MNHLAYRLRLTVYPVFLLVLILNGRSFWQKGHLNFMLLRLSSTLQEKDTSQYAQLERTFKSIDNSSNVSSISYGLMLLLAAESKEEAFDALWHAGNFQETQLFQWGELARHNQQYDDALDWYARALRVNPYWADPWYFSGIILEEKKQTTEALTAYKQAINAQVFTTIGLADVYTQIGRLHDASGNLSLAIVNYEQALSAGDFVGVYAEVYALNGVSSGLIRTGDFESAITLLSRAIELNQDYEWTYIRLSRAYEGCCEDYPLAIQYIEDAVRLNPKNKWGYYTAGNLYAASGQVDLAQQMYEQALNIDPDWDVVHQKLSELDG